MPYIDIPQTCYNQLSCLDQRQRPTVHNMSFTDKYKSSNGKQYLNRTFTSDDPRWSTVKEIIRLQRHIDATTAQLKTLKQELLAYAKQHNYSRLTADTSHLQRRINPTYNFTPETEQLRSDLNIREAQEIASGAATIKTATESLTLKK
jgi:Skp family chaperone for outer membrane proteins